MSEVNICHIKNNWDATAMLAHAQQRIEPNESVIVLFYEDGQLCRLSANMDHQNAVWMLELAKSNIMHDCIHHEWETQ